MQAVANNRAIRRVQLGLSGLAAAAILAVAVGGGAVTAQSTPTEGPPTAAASSGPSAGASEKTLNLAYLSFAVANSYDAPMLAAAKAAASALNATLDVKDANNDPAAQLAQLETALSNDAYDGIIVQPIVGPQLIPDIQTGIADGKKIAVVDQILGTDLTTDANQVDGLAANVVFVQSDIGTKQGQLAVQACTQLNLNPCNVGFLYNIKASSIDTAIRTAFDAAIAGTPSIKVVAEGEAFYSVAGGQTATSDMLTAHPEINLIVGADQGITGAVTAIDDAQRTGQIGLIGYGGAAVAYQRIAAEPQGQYATVAQLPASEGQYVVEDLVKAIRTGAPVPPRDPVAELPDNGIVTKDNVINFVAEWPG
jgi:ribose transport system substrate-binding protein